MNKLRRYFFPTIITLTALSVSGSAAFYSVSGLSKLFAGATFEVIIMAGSLEVAKLVIASLLYQYWDTINKLLRTYLSIAAVVLVLITSMGIYGFLSAAYQDTYRQLTIKTNQTAFLTQKKDFYNKDVIRYDQELERISNNISTLSNAKVSNIQVRDTTVSSGFRSTISTTELRLSQKRIEVEEENRQKVQIKREVAADSLQKYQIEILTLENNSEVAGELGPLQYLSGLTGTPMDKIINILLLIIIFVFDPLAISLVIAANFAFDKANRKNLYGELENDVPSNLDLYSEEDERRMDIIGRNGNEGEHYEVTGSVPDGKEFNVAYDIEVEEDWKTLNEDDTELEDKTKAPPITIKKILQKGPSNDRVLLSNGKQAMRRTKGKDENKITYL